MQVIDGVVNFLNTYLYSYVLIVLLICGGIYYTVVTKAAQFRGITEGCKLLFDKREDKKGISSFQALMVSTASRVGVGNIAGVATAIAFGGKGAVFWMWVTALLGGATALVESTLAQVYKKETERGRFVGGPAYYIEKALKNRVLGVVFSISLIFTFAYGYELLQANIIIGGLGRYLGTVESNFYGVLVASLLLACATAYAIFGGQRHIAKITSKIVPFMAALYLVFSLVIIVKNVVNVPRIFADIFTNAFDVQTIFAGFAGSCIMQGIRRGLYSNEAGMGSAPNAAATVTVSHPIKQGLVQMIAVYLDTIIICSATALMLLSTNVPLTGGALPLVQEAVLSQFGEIGVAILTVTVFLFAYSTLVGNYFYVEGNVTYITRREHTFILMRLSVVIVIFIGGLVSLDLAYNIADLAQGLMTIINVPVLIALTVPFLRVYNDYYAQRKAGKDPVFIAKNCGLETEYWKAENGSGE